MNENLNLVEILKDCPKGTKLYCTLLGEVELLLVDHVTNGLPILIGDEIYHIALTKNGRYFTQSCGECILFPSKDVRTWEGFKPKKPKFDPNTLKPFDKVLLKNENNKWNCALISHIESNRIYLSTGGYVYYCIPYNEDTKHLVGTTEEPLEFYRYWGD